MVRTCLWIFFLLRIISPREFLLDLLGWKEKRGLVSPLSQSPLGQPLVPRSEWGKGLVVGLKNFFSYLTTSSSKPSRGTRAISHPDEGGEREEVVKKLLSWKDKLLYVDTMLF